MKSNDDHFPSIQNLNEKSLKEGDRDHRTEQSEKQTSRGSPRTSNNLSQTGLDDDDDEGEGNDEEDRKEREDNDDEEDDDEDDEEGRTITRRRTDNMKSKYQYEYALPLLAYDLS